MAKKAIYNEEIIRNIVAEEISKLDWGEYKVSIEDKPHGMLAIYYLFDNVGALTDYNTKTVVFYEEGIMGYADDHKPLLMKNKASKLLCWLGTKTKQESLLRSLVREIVVHEWRHTQQARFADAHGIDFAQLTDIESNSEYGEGILEADAHKFAKQGIDTPMEVVFKNYLK